MVLVPGLAPDAIDVTNPLQPSRHPHWFGTDNMGRDYFARVLYGGRISLVVGVLAMLTCIVFGVIIGTVSGYFGGLVDSILMRLVDVFQSIPWIIMVTVVGRGVLEDAVKHPENYKDLIVRVSGFSAVFVNLEPDIQQELMSRVLYD